MNKKRRNFNKTSTDIKKVLYIAGGILLLSIIAFISIYILGSGKKESDKLAKINTSIIDNYNSVIEETSSQMDKTVNEMSNTETSMQTNEINSNTVANENTTKYAVNTSNTETKTINEKNKENKTKEEENSKKEVKEPEFSKPVEGEIMRKYAKENLVYSPTLDEWITHNGVDIIAEKTTVVKASEAGTVKSIKNDPRYGLTVIVEHAKGFTSVYANLLTAEFVEEGEQVKKGQTLGTVGNTSTFEIADESHLHFELLKDNEYVDPELYY